METIPGYGRLAAACDRTILHLREVLRYRVTFKMRPTTTPSASTSKSSSFHSPDGRESSSASRFTAGAARVLYLEPDGPAPP